jgi:hypothetical protein
MVFLSLAVTERQRLLILQTLIDHNRRAGFGRWIKPLRAMVVAILNLPVIERV